MKIDPGNLNCDTARDEYARGYDTGMADAYDSISPETGDEYTWYDQGYKDGYEEMNKE